MINLFTSVIIPAAKAFGKKLTQLKPFITEAFAALLNNTAKSASQMEPINDHSSAEDVKQIADFFETYMGGVETETKKIGQAVKEEMQSYFEEVNMTFQENKELMEKYQIQPKGADRKMKRLLDSVKRNLDDSVSKDISLYNADCKKIIGMIPGTKKEEAMSQFLKDAINHALDSCCIQLRETLEDIFQDMEEEVPGAAQKVATDALLMAQDYEKLVADNSSEKVEQLKVIALEKIAICEITVELLEG